MLSLIKIIIAKSEIFWPHCGAMHGKLAQRARRPVCCPQLSALLRNNNASEDTRDLVVHCAVVVRENWFSFISSARRLRFHLQHDKDQKVVFLKKRQRKRQKRKKIFWIFCEMAVLQLFCIILVSSSKFFINDVSAAYSCPIRDEAFELVTGKMFYPYVLTKNLKNALESILLLRKTCQFHIVIWQKITWIFFSICQNQDGHSCPDIFEVF